METEKEILTNLLKERGMFDFKPFYNDDSSEQLWGYCTQTGDCRSFHLCKSNLEEVPTNQLTRVTPGFPRPFYLLRVSDEAYSVLPEEVDISETSDSGWLVNSKSEVISTCVPGYSIVGNYLILSPKLEEKSFGAKDVLCWTPERLYPMYFFSQDTLSNHDDTMMYCSYYGYHIGHSKYGYFVFDENDLIGEYRVFLSKSMYYHPDSFLVYNTRLYFVRYSVEHYHELVWEAYHYDIVERGNIKVEVVLQIKTGIEIKPIDSEVPLYGCEIEWICSHNYFALTNLQHNSASITHQHNDVKYLCIASWSWAWSKSTVFSNYSKVYLYVKSQTLCSTIIESDNYLVRVGNEANGIVVLGNDNYWEAYENGKWISTSGRYFIYDIYGEVLADNVLKKNEYAIITKSIPDKGHLITTTDDKYLLSGVLRMEDLTVVVPMQYPDVFIEATNPDLVVLVRIDYWGNSRYEMYRNGKAILPKTISDCELSKMESEKMVLVREGDKYDIVYKGERCLPSKYDMIEEIKPNVCLLLTDGEEKRIYIVADKYISRSYHYLNIIFGDCSRVIYIGDDSLVTIENEEEEVLIEDCPSLKLICSDKNNTYFIFEEDELGFVCFSKWGDEVELEDYDSVNVECYKIEGDSLWFVPKERVIVDNLSKYCDNDNDHCDNYDYDEDTYYALGGTDYDKFRENGGSIDDMMDGMGL